MPERVLLGGVMPDFRDVMLGVQVVLSVFLVWVNYRVGNRISKINRKLDGSLNRLYRVRELLVNFHRAGMKSFSYFKQNNAQELYINMSEMAVCQAEMQGITANLDAELEKMVLSLDKLMSEQINDDGLPWSLKMQTVVIKIHRRVDFLVSQELIQA